MGLLLSSCSIIFPRQVNFGLMHASTVSAIISGIKPFIACFLIALFTFRIKTHTRLIRLIDAVRDYYLFTHLLSSRTKMPIITAIFEELIPITTHYILG